MKQFTLGQYTLEDFADYLNGAENEYFDCLKGNELVLNGEHTLTKTLNINFPMTLTGNDATIRGSMSGISAIMISASNTTIKNLSLNGFMYGVEIDALGQCVEHILVDNVTMYAGLNTVDIGSSLSNSILRDIRVTNCKAIVDFEEWQDYEYPAMSVCFNVCCSRHKGGDNIDNCLLEDVVVENCIKKGQTRSGIIVGAAMPAGPNLMIQDLSYSNLVVRDIHIINNVMEFCWDTALTVVGGFINTGAVFVEDVEFIGNTCYYGICGMTVCGGAHHFGNSGGSIIQNVKMNNNILEKAIDDVGETTRAIVINASRGDYYAGITSSNYLVKNIEIANNTINGAGIALVGSFTFLDGPSWHYNNIVSDVFIHNNKINDAEIAFSFNGAEAEGRQYDWNFGYPRHCKKWTDEVDDDSVVTAVFKGNEVKNITCVDNTISGFRYRVFASGAWGLGHASFEDNKVTENLVFERNNFELGENRINVKDVISVDYIKDLGGNKVSDVFKKR